MLEVRNIHKDYEGKPLLTGIQFTVTAGETVCLLGPSGGGKSTLLRIIAGLEEADAGQVLWNGQSLEHVPPHRRNFGFMFQDYALFPHRSVFQNIAFGLRMQGVAPAEIEKRVQHLLNLVNLTAFGARRVTDLSGGEQQRVALARTLAPNPQLLMLDEPLGALDRTLSEQLAAELRQILRAAGTPTLYVTHDQQEAFTVAERILLIHDGRIVQDGTPWEMYHRPASLWTARFFGLDNLVDGEVLSTRPYRIRTRIGTFEISPESPPAAPGERVSVLIRSDDIRREPDAAHPNHLHGQVQDAIFQGSLQRVDLCVEDVFLRFYLPSDLPLQSEVDLYFSPASATCILPGNEG